MLRLRVKARGWIVAALGIAAGFANGLFGGGGGMLAVPILNRFCNLDTQKAHASAIAAVAPMTWMSATIYWMRSDPVAGLWWTVVGVVAGGVAGALLLKKLSSGFLKYLFAAIMVAAGLRSAIGG